MTGSMWEYGQDQSDWADDRLVNYSVEATDGGIGKIDSATAETGAQCVVVNTSKLPMMGEKVMLPAGTIERVDHDDECVYVSYTKDQIKNAPEYDEQSTTDPSFRDKLGDYYGGLR
jgi:stress response protein YsnF